MILYIEDEKEIGEWVKGALEESGHNVQWFTSGEGIEDQIGEVSLVLLDVMLPGLDGFTIGKRIKKHNPELPIMMLTARSAVDDKVYGLQFADDYMVKPFHLEELLARMDVLFRRFGASSNQSLILGDIEVNLHTNQLLHKPSNKEIILSGKQYKIFFYLVQHLNQILTKEQIYEAIWGERYLDGDKSLMVHMRHLREKIEKDPSHPQIVQTIRGIGYRVKG